MNLLVYVNFSNRSKAGLYRSVFSRINQIAKSEHIRNLHMISVHEDYKMLIKKISQKRGYINNFKKNENGFHEGNIYCKYIKVSTYLFNKILDKLIVDYYIDRIFKTFVKKLKVTDYDAIIVHSAYPNVCIAKKLKDKYKIPYVVTLHGSDINVKAKESMKMRTRIIEGLENAEKCIFVSERLLNTAKDMGYSGCNSIIIPNGFDKEIFRPMNKNKIKKELGIDGKHVGYIGNLITIKNADKLPLIFKGIQDKYKNVIFTVLGDGNLRNEIEHQCNLLGLNIGFYGKVDANKVPYYLNSMDVLILPSQNEGWPCVVVEALACHVPVVGSNKGGIPEAIGTCGEIVEDGELFVDRFSNAVVKVLNDKKSYKYEEHISEFSWDALGYKERSIIDILAKEYSADNLENNLFNKHTNID